MINWILRFVSNCTSSVRPFYLYDRDQDIFDFYASTGTLYY